MKWHEGGRLARSLTPLVVAVVATLIASPTSVAAAALEPELETRISAHIAAQLERLGVPGAAVAVVSREGIAFAQGYGTIDDSGAPVTGATPFQIASVSKLITATAVMQLVESGELALNARVGDYIGWFAAGGSAHASITVRDLLAHTSGLSRRDGLANWTDDLDDAGALERNVRRLAGTPLSHSTGTFAYSNANYDVLGYLVETVSGTSYDEYLAEHVFGPLGMQHSHVSVAHAAGLAQGHYPFMGAPIQIDIPFVRGSAPSAFLMASAEDLGLLLSALLNDGANMHGRVLDRGSAAVMQRPLVLTGNGSSAYAMGLRVVPLSDLGTLHERRSGAIDYEVPVSLQHGGDHATYAAHVLLLPREGWGVAIVMNLNDVTAPGEYHRLAEDVAAILLGRDPRTPASFDGAMVEHAKMILFAVLALEAWAVARSLRTSGARRRAASRPLRARIALSAVVTAAIGLGIAGSAVWLVLEHADAPLALAPRLAPDIALVLLGIVVLGVAWGPARVVLLLRAAYGRRLAG